MVEIIKLNVIVIEIDWDFIDWLKVEKIVFLLDLFEKKKFKIDIGENDKIFY